MTPIQLAFERLEDTVKLARKVGELEAINADLLAALEKVAIDYQDMRHAYYSHNPDSKGDCPALQQARTAIAKAKGVKE